MAKIVYIEADGSRHEVEVDEDLSLMEGATLNMVPGVEGMCGGVCSCATCHCYIEAEWADKLPAPEPGELEMLAAASHRKASSRLGCQVKVTAALDGMEVYLPEEQG